jgi:dolichol kinase
MISAYAVSGKLGASAAVAAFATIVEALPAKDWDNILLPLAAGLMATLLGM